MPALFVRKVVTYVKRKKPGREVCIETWKLGVGLVIFNRDILPLAADVGTEIVFREPQLQSALTFYRSLTLRRGKIRLLMEMIAVKDRKKRSKTLGGF